MRTILILATLTACVASAQRPMVDMYETNKVTRIGHVNLFTVEMNLPKGADAAMVSAFLSLGYDHGGWVIPGYNPGRLTCHLVPDPLFWLTVQAVPGNNRALVRDWNVMALLTPARPQYQWMVLILPDDRRLLGLEFYGQPIVFDPFFQYGPTTWHRPPVFTGKVRRFEVTR